jgi:glyoxylase-like metal-dependent hydrolase (beta-lactamase superfamily II)
VAAAHEIAEGVWLLRGGLPKKSMHVFFIADPAGGVTCFDAGIALWHESDRLALTSDCFHPADPQTGRDGAPRVPPAAFNLDTEQARASLRKLAALEPATAWPGHADPLRGDVRGQLERAAATT